MEHTSITVKDVKIRYKSVQSYSIKKNLLRLKAPDAKVLGAERGVRFED